MQLSNYPGAEDNNQQCHTEHFYWLDKQYTRALNREKCEESGDTEILEKRANESRNFDTTDWVWEGKENWSKPNDRATF